MFPSIERGVPFCIFPYKPHFSGHFRPRKFNDKVLHQVNLLELGCDMQGLVFNTSQRFGYGAIRPVVCRPIKLGVSRHHLVQKLGDVLFSRGRIQRNQTNRHKGYP